MGGTHLASVSPAGVIVLEPGSTFSSDGPGSVSSRVWLVAAHLGLAAGTSEPWACWLAHLGDGLVRCVK